MSTSHLRPHCAIPRSSPPSLTVGVAPTPIPIHQPSCTSQSSERRETATALYFPVFQKAGSALKVLYLLLWCSAHHHLYAARRQIARYAALQLIVCGFVDSGLLRGFPQPRGGPNSFGPGGSSRPPRGDCGCARATRRCWQCGAPLVRSQGLRPAAHTTPHAARCTPHAARRTPHRLLSNGRCGNARSHAGAQLAERARLQGSSRLSSFSCLSSSSRIFFIVRPCWRCFCSGAQTVSTQRTEAHRKLRVVCAPLAGCPTFRRA